MLELSTNIQYLKGVGEKRAALLRKKGIDTVGALLHYFPRAYLDWRDVRPLSECPFDENVIVKAKIVTPVQAQYVRQGMTLFKFLAEDDTMQMVVTLFNQKYLAEKLHKDCEYLFYGKVTGDLALRQMSSPEIAESGAQYIQPIYPASPGMPSKTIEKLVKTALSLCETLPDALPEEIRTRNGLCDISYAVKNIHFPAIPEALESAKRRLVFEELFVLQTGLSFLKKRRRGRAGWRVENADWRFFREALPFALTGAQQRVIEECLRDMTSGCPMNRLVQGDVGSGKTAVAAALCSVAANNGFQSVLMAPTEILAEQHYATLTAMTGGAGVTCALLTGSMTKKQKNAVKQALRNGEIDIAVGTHALLSEDVEFDRLGLVITDEQHRFGVAQRGKLAAKGQNPHTLVMSATPIPRTLGLIVYGDLDISVIDEYPRGRQKIATYLVDSSYHERIYRFIQKFLDEGRQGYIVCPMVEETENIDLKSAEEYYEELKNGVFAQDSVGLLHGKMRAKEKDAVMRRFAAGEVQLLVTTTVIEVGIDVPNAVVMVIENAERFGLSQLHQLRGRIGRGQYASTCILVSDSRGADTSARLQVIKNNNDGFAIAEEDLKLRGPGDFLGNRQHGLPDMKIADLFADRETLHLAGTESERLLKEDPTLQEPKNQPLKQAIDELYERLNQN